MVMLELLLCPSQVGGYWSTGRPYLDLNVKSGPSSWEAGIQLPLLHTDVSELKVCEVQAWPRLASPPAGHAWPLSVTSASLHLSQAKLLALPPDVWDPSYQREHNAVIQGRDDNMNKFKPGVGAM